MLDPGGSVASRGDILSHELSEELLEKTDCVGERPRENMSDDELTAIDFGREGVDCLLRLKIDHAALD